jgi:hypothetical protein
MVISSVAAELDKVSGPVFDVVVAVLFAVLLYA